MTEGESSIASLLIPIKSDHETLTGINLSPAVDSHQYEKYGRTSETNWKLAENN
jgi:hypothetical protein